ncbi:hypothetical protein RB195_019107 [Necator americanus]|uniref:Uncharacterized protein n=1 Tax=Necator americanus TaxID=51031 RepID=A0ABR1CDQ1_NECAM
MMLAKKIKYEVVEPTETRRRHLPNTVYETGEELFLGTCDSRGIVGVFAITNVTKNIDNVLSEWKVHEREDLDRYGTLPLYAGLLSHPVEGTVMKVTTSSSLKARLTTFTLFQNSSKYHECTRALCLTFDVKKGIDSVNTKAIMEALDNQDVLTRKTGAPMVAFPSKKILMFSVFHAKGGITGTGTRSEQMEKLQAPTGPGRRITGVKVR